MLIGEIRRLFRFVPHFISTGPTMRECSRKKEESVEKHSRKDNFARECVAN